MNIAFQSDGKLIVGGAFELDQHGPEGTAAA